MLSIDEIKAMSDEEIAATNRKLMKKIIVTRIVVPMAFIVATHVVVTVIERQLDKKSNH